MSKKVQIYTQVSDGQGDVVDAWIDGEIVGEASVSASLKAATGQRPGIVVKVPKCAFKDKHIFVEDALVGTVVRS